jgi:hypothetical protein
MKRKISIIGLIMDIVIFSIGGLLGLILSVPFWKGFLIGVFTIAVISLLKGFLTTLTIKNNGSKGNAPKEG